MRILNAVGGIALTGLATVAGAAAWAQDALQGLETVGKPEQDGLNFQPAVTELMEDIVFFDTFLLYYITIITVLVTAALAYVVVRGASVLELVDQTDDGRGSARLLQHVGADAIDQGRYSVRLQCPLSSPAHVWADQAGGQLFTDAVQDCWMVKILSKRTLLRRLAHEMYRRKPKSLTELGIRIGNEELLIRNGVRSMKVTRGNSTKHQIGLTNRAAAQLFLGYRSVQELAEHRELVASDDVAMAAASEPASLRSSGDS